MFKIKFFERLGTIRSFSISLYRALGSTLSFNVYFGRRPSTVPAGAVVFFPYRDCTLYCGLAGIIAFRPPATHCRKVDIDHLEHTLKKIQGGNFASCRSDHRRYDEGYLGGAQNLAALWRGVQDLKQKDAFCDLYLNNAKQDRLRDMSRRVEGMIAAEQNHLSEQMGLLTAAEIDIISHRIDILRDVQWSLSAETIGNIARLRHLRDPALPAPAPATITLFKELNAVLNSIDRLEVRGRDSAGISLLFVLKPDDLDRFRQELHRSNLDAEFRGRLKQAVLVNRCICIQEKNADGCASLTLTYKIAAEIGNLGDNIRFIRKQIRQDSIFQILATFPLIHHTILCHTRWASVGAISEANCHPVDDRIIGTDNALAGRIHVCLNGDIDNYQDLRTALETRGYRIHQDITTDTKIIPLQISRYLNEGHAVDAAFRLAVNDFKGSHAISMHTDLAPGKLFLAQKGSGQAVFIGLADDHYMPTSEVYGFIEETPRYLKMDGEKVARGQNGDTQGQIFILDQQSEGGLKGIQALYYDGTPLPLSRADIKQTEITTRDIDRQQFPHYFLKEISESPASVEKTLLGRWKINPANHGLMEIALDESVLPASIRAALEDDTIRRVFFVGQGTAGVAALACADLLDYYMGDDAFYIRALKASELSGFKLDERDRKDSMADALVIAISQSGTTTDTNRTIDMVRQRGAYTMAIVNRRDSDITFKVGGVMYTSTGRDIEMSVASTKAFYSQIVAGALLGLFIARLKQRRNAPFVSFEIQQLLDLPRHMRSVLSQREAIEISAGKHAVAKTYWAAVGSGPNKAAADEIRIKLSELCYKTISSDYIEDKKHIDLSSEPLIIVCAAGTKGHVIGDIIKDTAIFQAHKATPVVIADQGEDRFDPYAADVFKVPSIAPHFAPVLNTLVGHLWGYYAALAINQGSLFLYKFREDLQNTIYDYSEKGLDIYEVVLENTFREKVAQFYNAFKCQKEQKRFPVAMGADTASNLTLLLKYLAGRLPVSDFEIDFNRKGTALNMINSIFECIAEAINAMARPIDAIKHQAKTVTVGTSRIREEVEGILFEALAARNFNVSHLTNSNIIVLKNLQGIVSEIKGAILYRIDGLSLLGELTDSTTITLEKKEGSLLPLTSRVEKDNTLKGTKRIIVRQGNVYMGKGRKDDRSIIIIPVISDSPAAPNQIEHLLLLHIDFKTDVTLPVKIRALGGKYEHIKNIVQENSIAWEDPFLERVQMNVLFGVSAEKIGDLIVSGLNRTARTSGNSA